MTSPLYWPSAFLSRSPGCLTGGPGAQLSAGCCFLYIIIFPSLLFPKLVVRGSWGPLLLGAGFLYRISSPNSIGGPEGPFCRVLFFSTASSLQTDWISCALSYIIVQRPFLWNGMFWLSSSGNNCHAVHPLPVNQFVTVPWDFNPIPYCQPSSPTPMEYALPSSLEWHLWPGRRSIYNTISVEYLLEKHSPTEFWILKLVHYFGRTR